VSGAIDVVLDEIVDGAVVGRISPEEFAEKVIGLVDELLVNEVTLDELEEDTDEVDEVVAGGTTLELRLLVDVGDVEEIDVFVGDTIVLVLRLEVVDSNEDDVSLELELRTEVVEPEDGTISLELDLKVTDVIEELVMGTDTLELELLR
jgi:hypothetical protein